MNKLTPVTDDYALYDFIRSYHTSNTDFLILEITHTEEGTVKKYVFDDYNDYRSQEYVIIEDGNFEVYILLRDELKAEAYWSLGKTTFILLIIMISTLLISKDATELVLQPLESIMMKVKEMAEDPFQIIKFSEIEAAMLFDEKKKKKTEALYETAMLDNAITKIGALLLLSFGEAGSSLISEMISKEGNFEVATAGKKTIGIFGFWDIRQFTDTTEILQEDVMAFVNEIARVVHGETHEYLGDPNKNIGDAFLLVWKFPENEIYTGLNGELWFSKDSYLINNYAEWALIAILKTIWKMSKDPRILSYSNNKKLWDRIPDYKVKMGFGLHTGWCIEGAIGSSYKIDATYLSHHVNYASSLEEKTKTYGILLAISHEFYEICSAKARSYFRQVDWYRQKGSKTIYKIYTVDVETSWILEDPSEYNLTGKQHYNK
jgi:class 3 adenylate cyclase